MLQFSLQRIDQLLFLIFQILTLSLAVESGPVHGASSTPKTTKHNVKLTTTAAPSTVNNTYITSLGTQSTSLGAKGHAVPKPKDIAMRAFYVISAICLVVVLYFLVRAIYSRRRRSKTRRYGMLRQEGGDMELRPLSEGEDEEEDDLIFDASQRKSGTRR